VRDDRARLLDILEAIEKIERYASVAKDLFARDELVQTWMVHHLQIIGEAVSQLSDELRARHPDVPWRAIAAMRHAIVHAYYRVDLDEVWSVVKNDLPGLKARLQEIRERESDHEGADAD
jgi:uncharacterized protein with HEPN domain